MANLYGAIAARPAEIIIDSLTELVSYDPLSGAMETAGQYPSKGVYRGRANFRFIPLPLDLNPETEGYGERKGEGLAKRETKYYRADHIAWALMVGDWPEGYIRHCGALMDNQRIEDLIHVDSNHSCWWFGATMTGATRMLHPCRQMGLILQADNGDIEYRPELIGDRHRNPDGSIKEVVGHLGMR